MQSKNSNLQKQDLEKTLKSSNTDFWGTLEWDYISYECDTRTFKGYCRDAVKADREAVCNQGDSRRAGGNWRTIGVFYVWFQE